MYSHHQYSSHLSGKESIWCHGIASPGDSNVYLHEYKFPARLFEFFYCHHSLRQLFSLSNFAAIANLQTKIMNESNVSLGIDSAPELFPHNSTIEADVSNVDNVDNADKIGCTKWWRRNHWCKHWCRSPSPKKEEETYLWPWTSTRTSVCVQ